MKQTNFNYIVSASQDPTQTAWCNGTSADCIDRPLFASNSTTNTITNVTSYPLENNESKGIYSMGNYYNWYSATAGTGTHSVETGNAAGSICPAGWHLPTGGTGGEFPTLDIAMGGTGLDQSAKEASRRWRAFPVNHNNAGQTDISSFYGRGDNSGTWSSTASPGGAAYLLGIDHWSVVTGAVVAVVRFHGVSVRCVR
ncbi:MAG: FISUMP domain-containing protein [Candidatus Saccharibacteria bacterium]|nr:FISUMP domain-containing protein [Candidatus Saccharibacteria bacterium]